jgi:hypothetical protein
MVKHTEIPDQFLTPGDRLALINVIFEILISVVEHESVSVRFAVDEHYQLIDHLAKFVNVFKVYRVGYLANYSIVYA